MNSSKQRYVFKSSQLRLQLTVHDFTNPPSFGGKPIMTPKRVPTFSLYCLATTAHRSTAFEVAGEQVYYGEDPRQCIGVISKHAPYEQWPRELRPYLLRWSLQAVVDSLRLEPRPAKDSLDEIAIRSPKDKSERVIEVVYCDGGWSHFSPNADYPEFTRENRAKLAATGTTLGYRMEELNSWSVGFYE